METSRFWQGTTVGDAATEAPYDSSTEFAEVLTSLAGAGAISPNLGGVFRGELDALLASVPGANTVRIATGRALVYGNWYENDADNDVTVPTPSVSTRIDRIVLRKSWAAQTVRVTRIAGVEGGGVPAMTQNAGVTWDIPLVQASITTGATITLTDEREFIQSRQIAIVKTATETVNNSATLQDDDTFVFAVGAGQTWTVRQFLKVAGVVAAGIQMAWDLPAGGSYTISAFALAGGSVGADTDTDNPITLSGTAWPIIVVESVLTIDATAGVAQFQWAQAAATVTDTQVLAASDLTATQAV